MKPTSTDNPPKKKTQPKEQGACELDRTGTAHQDKHGYEIKLKNHLDQQWAQWFDGWTITNTGDDEVILRCAAVDHAGLHGALDKIRDLNLAIISVKRI